VGQIKFPSLPPIPCFIFYLFYYSLNIIINLKKTAVQSQSSGTHTFTANQPEFDDVEKNTTTLIRKY